MKLASCAVVVAALLAAVGCEGNVSSAPLTDAGAGLPAPPPPAPPGNPTGAVAEGDPAAAGVADAAAPADGLAQPAAAEGGFGAAPDAAAMPAADAGFAAPAADAGFDAPPASDAGFGATAPADDGFAPPAAADAGFDAPAAADDGFGAPAAGDAFAAEDAGFGAATEQAKVGVGAKGRNYGGPGLVTTPVQQYFKAGEQIAFNIQIPHAMKLYKASNNNQGPRTHEEFMNVIISENGVQLPELPAGDEYLYDPKSEQLLVKHSAQ